MGLQPSSRGRVRGRGPRSEAECWGPRRLWKPSAAGGGIATTPLAMNSGRQRRTPFSIADILGPSMVPGAPSEPRLPEAGPDPASPLCALEELASKTFQGHSPRAPQPSEGTRHASKLPSQCRGFELCVYVSVCPSVRPFLSISLSLSVSLPPPPFALLSLVTKFCLTLAGYFCPLPALWPSVRSGQVSGVASWAPQVS